MRVIDEKKVTAKTGEKSVLHGIEEKTELSKKKESVGIVNNAKRTLGDENTSKTPQERASPNIPKAVQKHVKSDAPTKHGGTSESPVKAETGRGANSNIAAQTQGRTKPDFPHLHSNSSVNADSGVSKNPRAIYSTNSENTTKSQRAINSTAPKSAAYREKNVNTPKRSAPRDMRIGAEKKEIPNGLKARFKQSAVRSKKRVIYPQQIKDRADRTAKSKGFKVLKNGTVSKTALLKIRKHQLDKKVKRNKTRLHFKRVDVSRYKRRMPEKQQTYGEVMREKKRIETISEHFEKAAPAVSAAALSVSDVDKSVSAVTETAEKAAVAIKTAEKGAAAVETVVNAVKSAVPVKKVLSQAKNAAGKTVKTVSGTARTIYKPVTAASKVIEPFSEIAVNQSESAAKDGIRFGQITAQVTQSVTETSEKAVKKTASGVKRAARTVSNITKNHEKRKLQKTVKRKVGKTKRELKTAEKAAKAAVKTTKNAAKTTAKTTQKTADAATKVGKAITHGIARIASFIASTMPWSAIIIGIAAVILLIVFLVISLISSAAGGVAGSGGWVISDTDENSESDIYDNLNDFIDDAKDVCDDNVKEPLESEISTFCEEVEDPQRIIAYTVGDKTGTVFPATGADTTINGYIDDYLAEKMTDEEYAKFLAALFVLMTREKQESEGEGDAAIYDFDFEKADFEEFIGEVDSNTCRFGSTFIIKTTVETSGEKCPDEDCDTETHEGCNCASSTDPETGEVHTYCGGHSYCPGNHTKLTVSLKTVEDDTGKTIPEIYAFTDNEKARYEAASAFIAALLADKEAGII